MLIQEIRSAASARILELKQEIEALRTPGDLTAARVAKALKKPGIFGEKFHMPDVLCDLVGEFAATTENEKRELLEDAEREHQNVTELYNKTSLPPVVLRDVCRATCTCSTGLLIARGGAWSVATSWSTPCWFLGAYFCGSVALSGFFTASCAGPLMLTMERDKVKERCKAIEQRVLVGTRNFRENRQLEDYANSRFAEIAEDLLKRKRESQARSSSIERTQSQAQDELKLD